MTGIRNAYATTFTLQELNGTTLQSFVDRKAHFRGSLPAIIKGYQGDELWTAVNPATGRREIVDPEGEFIAGETIVKLFYYKRLDGYVTIPGASLFRVAGDGFSLEQSC